MRLIILGGLGYHNDTIIQPIINEANSRLLPVVWKTLNEDGANVHLPDFTDETIKLWVDFLNNMQFEDNDRILVADFWNPMIFAMKFNATRKEKGIKFFTIHHGSSDLDGDFSSMPEYKEWCSKSETAWASCYDGIFFGSNVVRDKFIENHGSGKYTVAHLPISYIEETINQITATEKIERVPNKVIMPLRPDYDKGFDLFLEYAHQHPEKTFFVGSPVPQALTNLPDNVKFMGQLSRNELFRVMLSCEEVVSFARQETFGYAVLEAVLCGCKFISNYSEGTAYKELYSNFDETYVRLKLSEAKIVDEITS